MAAGALYRAENQWTEALLVGAYSVCYLLALDLGVTPGFLATLLGVQPGIHDVEGRPRRRWSMRKLTTPSAS